MKKVFLVLAILTIFLKFCLSQNSIKQDLITFVSSERNSKEISIKLIKSKAIDFVQVMAHNNGQDQIYCKWKSELQKEHFLKLTNELSYFVDECNSKLEFNFKNNEYSIICKKNKIKLIFHSSVCERGQKIGLFQRQCSRTLSFVLTKENLKDILKAINLASNFNSDFLVKN